MCCATTAAAAPCMQHKKKNIHVETQRFTCKQAFERNIISLPLQTTPVSSRHPRSEHPREDRQDLQLLKGKG